MIFSVPDCEKLIVIKQPIALSAIVIKRWRGRPPKHCNHRIRPHAGIVHTLERGEEFLHYKVNPRDRLALNRDLVIGQDVMASVAGLRIEFGKNGAVRE